MELLDLLSCPACDAKLSADQEALHCPACGRRYEVIHGIPDFRPDPPTGTRHGELCLKVIERWSNASYRELWAICHSDEPDALERLWAEHEEQAPQRGERRWDEIVRSVEAVRRQRETDLPSSAKATADRLALDIGCGMGSALFAMARHARLALGLDILLTDLLLAKKRFAEADIENVALVCGSATELPLRDESFDVLNATDVIEHMPDQTLFLREARRVMRPGGVFFFNSPNRFSLLTPEPHVRLWGVGWLPRRWMEPYVRWRLGKPYRGKRLLSLFELRRLVREAFGGQYAIRAFIPRGGPRSAAGGFLEALTKPVLPQHNVLVWK